MIGTAGDRKAVERAAAAEVRRRARYREAMKAGRLLDAVVPDCEVALRDLVGRGLWRIGEALEDDDGRKAAAWLGAIRACLLLYRDLTAWQREQDRGSWHAEELGQQIRIRWPKLDQADTEQAGQ